MSNGVRVGSAPTIPLGSSSLGALAPNVQLAIDVALKPRDASGLAAYAEDVSTPGDAVFHHFLTARQFTDVFGPTQNALDRVEDTLRSEGLSPGAVSSNHLLISLSASAQQLETAFSLRFERFSLGDGRAVFLNTQAPKVPAAAAPYVVSIIGLDDLFQVKPQGERRAAAASVLETRSSGNGPTAIASTGGPTPCARAVKFATKKGPESGGAYTADAIASAYGLPALYQSGDLGAGQTVAVLEFQHWHRSDVDMYQSCYGIDTPISTISVDGGPAKGSGVGEANGDIEDIMGLAPAANIWVYQAPNSGKGWVDDWNDAVSTDGPKVISVSWGNCEPFFGKKAQVENTILEEAATQGQSFFAAAGDSGSEDCLGPHDKDGELAVLDPAAQPFITGVGGTQWTSPISPPGETVWNDGVYECSGVEGCFGAGGGGISEYWTMPPYQVSAATSVGVVNNYSSGVPCGAPTGTDCREVPDVSALSGLFPFVFYQSGHWQLWGGTSFAAPLWAAFIALTNASPACRGTTVGFVNPLLYETAGTDQHAFNDVTTGDNDISGGNGGLFPALTGYDMASGLGTPNVPVLSDDLCSVATAGPASR